MSMGVSKPLGELNPHKLGNIIDYEGGRALAKLISISSLDTKL
jgi:hypothetical protein